MIGSNPDALYSRSTAELYGGEGTSGTVGVVQQLLDRDADGNDSDRVGVGLIEYGTQALDGLGLCQGGLHGVHGLDGSKQQQVRSKVAFKQNSVEEKNYRFNHKEREKVLIQFSKWFCSTVLQILSAYNH